QVENASKRKKIAQLTIALCSFLLLVVVANNLFELDFILIITLLIFLFACLWALVIGRWRSFWKIGWTKWKISMNNMHNFIVLFVTLSLFTNTFKCITCTYNGSKSYSI